MWVQGKLEIGQEPFYGFALTEARGVTVVGVFSRGGRAALVVDLPDESSGVVVEFGHIPRIEDVASDSTGGVAILAIGHQVVECNRENVAWLGTVDIERASLRITPLADLLAVLVFSARVDGRRRYGIPILDCQHGFVPADRGVVVVGYEFVSHRIPQKDEHGEHGEHGGSSPDRRVLPGVGRLS